MLWVPFFWNQRPAPVEIHAKTKQKKTWFLWWIPPEILTDLCVWQICVTNLFSVCDCYLASWTLAAAMAPFRLEGRKSHGVPIKNQNKFGEGWGCHLTILWGRSFKSWWTARISPRNLETPRTIKISATLLGTKISHRSREVRKIIDSVRAVYGGGYVIVPRRLGT